MVSIVVYCTIFMLGAVVSSALDCFLYRLDTDLDWVHGRSICESCGSSLEWWELIPVFSCLYLRGKCSHCHTYFGYRHMWLEILGGVLAVFTLYIQVTGRASFITTCIVCIVGISVLSVLSELTAHR